MGIKNLYKLILEEAPGAISIAKLDDLRGWNVAIDGNLSLYQWHSVSVMKNIRNSKNKYINHVQACFYKTAKLILAGINILYLFDSYYPIEKELFISKRKEIREKTNIKITVSEIKEVNTLLHSMNVEIYRASREAEQYGAMLTKIGTIDAVATEDMDALPFGAKFMIRDFGSDENIVINRAELLRLLDLNNNQFIDLCILLGCDYTGTLPGIGYKKAFQLIKKYNSIENILKHENLDSSKMDYKAARAIFLEPPVEDTARIVVHHIKMDQVDIASLYEYLIDKFELSKQKITNVLKKLAVHFNIKSPLLESL